jgi:hypothetical protein
MVTRLQTILILGTLLILIWVYLFFSLFHVEPSTGNEALDTFRQEKFISEDVHDAVVPKFDEKPTAPFMKIEDSGSKPVSPPTSSVVTYSSRIDGNTLLNDKSLSSSISRHYENNNQYFQADPPSVDEIKRNMTRYLHTLHSTLGSLAGPGASGEIVWEAFLNVTRSMPMTWDEENKHRFPRPRKDNSIFVSIGTYRDPFCPMTLKSLYKNAQHPENIFVGLFQQNCFGPVCRTGVLAGGRVEEAGADPDCYVEFCKSQENAKVQACGKGQVRLFNVNESESLGPYMARYLGSKFYRGEQYYLQIDSHSEFVENWDTKLIHMVESAPAEKPVISTYPPDSTQNWKNTIGFRMCDSEFASAQIEWQIIRLGW